MTASRTFDQSKAWENPNLRVPIEKAHLSMTKPDDPQIYEQLCVQHDIIKPHCQSGAFDIDTSVLESLLDGKKPFEQWNAASLNNIRESLITNPETRSNFRLYLSSGPDRTEATLIKDLMLEGVQQSSSLPEVNPLHDVMGDRKLRPNASLVSLLADGNTIEGRDD